MKRLASLAAPAAVALSVLTAGCGGGGDAAPAPSIPPVVCASGCQFTTIQAAIDAASAGAIITVGSGTYTEHDIEVSKGVTLLGAGAASTIVQAAASAASAPGRVLHVPAGVSARLEGMTIRNGDAKGAGGGGVLNEGTLEVVSCVVRDNFAGDARAGSGDAGGAGGGVLNLGTLTMRSSEVRDNRTGAGSTMEFGGRRMGQDGGEGGGIENRGTATISGSLVTGNATGRGGDGCDCTMLPDIPCLDMTGYSGEGGGIGTRDATLTLINSTVSGNTVSLTAPTGCDGQPAPVRGEGGGLLSAGSTLQVLFSTFSANTCPGPYQGGGLSIFFGATTLKGVLSSGNAPKDLYVHGTVALTSGGYNLVTTWDGTALAGTGDLLGTVPLLAPLAANGGPTATHLPAAGSPAVNAVPAAACTDAASAPLSVDQRGSARPSGGACDIGAVEL